MHLNRLGSTLSTLINGLTMGEAAGKSWDRHGVATGWLWLKHDCVSAHGTILSQGCSKLLGCDSRLRKD